MSPEQTDNTLGGLSSTPQANPVPTRIGKYRVDGVIGRGAVGVVYRGHDEQIDRPLAIKTLRLDTIANVTDRETLLKRFAAEARSAGRCLHPNIVTVFDFGTAGPHFYLLMEYNTIEECRMDLPPSFSCCLSNQGLRSLLERCACGQGSTRGTLQGSHERECSKGNKLIQGTREKVVSSETSDSSYQCSSWRVLRKAQGVE